jgi:hypothetical protein
LDRCLMMFARCSGSWAEHASNRQYSGCSAHQVSI